MKILDKILLTQDFSESSNNVVETAMELAKVFKSEVVPIHVLPDDIVNEKVKSLLDETAKLKLMETVKKMETGGAKVGEPLLKYGSPHDGIVRAAVEVNANLILTGSGENHKKGHLNLGTTTETIIEKSEKPVFVVKEGVPLNVKHILCPVDFSEESKRALKNAITIAHRFKAELIILGVCELQGSSWFTSEKDRKNENETRFIQHKAKFDTFLKHFNLSEALKVTKATPQGDPAEEILNAISTKKVDLLIMGTTGTSGLNRLIMGSVTKKVVREVPCSFLTLKSEDVISLHLETDMRDIEKLYETALKLEEDGFFQEAIEHFEACLNINNMHVPAYLGLAKVYEKLKNPEKAKIYRDNGMEIKDKIWYHKIEEEVRKLRGS